MPTSIRPQHHFRVFEELCRLKFSHVSEILQAGGTKVNSQALPDRGGVYAFWWTGDYSLLDSPKTSKTIKLKGPAGRQVDISINNFWTDPIGEFPIPLYVGKTADSLRKRIGLHLRLKEARSVRDIVDGKRSQKPTTTCQLRSGIDHLFPKKADTRNELMLCVGLSFVELHGDQFAADRFYIEDLAIGLMKPMFNVDIER
jgi:hypothetical protein